MLDQSASTAVPVCLSRCHPCYRHDGLGALQDRWGQTQVRLVCRVIVRQLEVRALEVLKMKNFQQGWVYLCPRIPPTALQLVQVLSAVGRRQGGGSMVEVWAKAPWQVKPWRR